MGMGKREKGKQKIMKKSTNGKYENLDKLGQGEYIKIKNGKL